MPEVKGDIMYNEIFNFINSLIPTKSETIIGGCSIALGTIFEHLIGGWSSSLETLLILMVLDYLTGISAAFINTQMKLDSNKCVYGIFKKIVILSLIALAYRIDLEIGQTMTKSIVLLFFIGSEGLSILENAANCGLPIPTKLKENLAQLTQQKKERK